tara:strand:- start:208 stop:783 length:576 start_codon:yes stop_codon:yes gene_type:complete
MKINQQIIFPTPLFEIEIPEIDNKKLSEDIYELRKSDKGMSKSNIGGWHSSTQHNKIDKIFKPVIDNIIKILPDLPFNPKISNVYGLELWANINDRYSYNNAHTHPGSDLSGVYYVKVPKKDCGNINFIDPRPALSHGNSFIVERYTGGESTPRFPIEGNMYIFPSSLPHEVGMNRTDEDRISISFNLNLR